MHPESKMLAFFVASLSFFPKNDPYARTWYEHVVDVGNVEVEYTVRAPAYVDINVTVPYIAKDTKAKGGKGIGFCPTSYLIDFADPSPAEYTGYPRHDGLGAAKSTCAAYSFVYDEERFDYPDAVADAQTYATPPSPLRCDPRHPYWFCKTPVEWRLERRGDTAVYSSTSELDHVSNYALGCRGTDGAAERVVRTTPLASYSTRYDWKLHVCAVGPYGPECDKSRYAIVCREFPASFVTRNQTLEDGSVVLAACTDAGPAPAPAVLSLAPADSEACPLTYRRFRVAFRFDGDAGPLAANVTHPVARPLEPLSALANETRYGFLTPCLRVGPTSSGYLYPEAVATYLGAHDAEGVRFDFVVTAPKFEGANETCAYLLSLRVRARHFLLAEFRLDAGETRVRLSMDEPDPFLGLAWVVAWFGATRALPLLVA